ncbi:MAG: zeta toxin family protein [Dolichospermum sp.]
MRYDSSFKAAPFISSSCKVRSSFNIAAGISPFNSESVAMEAGKLMLQRLENLVNDKSDFAFETTLAARNFARFIRECKNQDYIINLIYFWLESPELAISRVGRRVASGGHNIPENIIRRRYERGRRNLTDLYLPLCDTWIVYNNSGNEPQLVAESGINQEVIIYEYGIWNQITAR